MEKFSIKQFTSWNFCDIMYLVKFGLKKRIYFAIFCQACVFPWSLTLSKLPSEKPRLPHLARICAFSPLYPRGFKPERNSPQ